MFARSPKTSPAAKAGNGSTPAAKADQAPAAGPPAVSKTGGKGVLAEFELSGQNSRHQPLRLRWSAPESLYYGGKLEVKDGPEGIRTRYERRIHDTGWLKNDPNRIAGGRPFTENFFATVAVLMAFADAEKLNFEASRIPITSGLALERMSMNSRAYADMENFDRGEARDGEPSDGGSRDGRVSGSILSS